MPDLDALSDDHLLDMRMCDLKLTIRNTPLQHRIQQLSEELASRGIPFTPHCWLSDDWYSPDGIPGIAIPFYLAQPRLRSSSGDVVRSSSSARRLCGDLRGRTVHRPKKLAFPLFVKSVTEDASYGISQASIVHDDEALSERLRLVHEKTGDDAIAEQFVAGREIYVGVIGNNRLTTFPAWEMNFGKMPGDMTRIASSRVKWDRKYQRKHGITTHAAADIDRATQQRISKLCRRVYRALSMSGYGRMNLRMTAEGEIDVIEANANSNIEYGEDFSESAESIGLTYEALLQRILNLGLSYRAAWMNV